MFFLHTQSSSGISDICDVFVVSDAAQMNVFFVFLLYKCLAGLYKNGQLVEHPDCKPWVEDSYWEIKRSNNAIIEEAYKQFNGEMSVACDPVVILSVFTARYPFKILALHFFFNRCPS